jgi:hypothetical protein
MDKGRGRVQISVWTVDSGHVVMKTNTPVPAYNRTPDTESVTSHYSEVPYINYKYPEVSEICQYREKQEIINIKMKEFENIGEINKHRKMQEI